MKLYIKQKPLSWRDKFTAKDENGNDRYTMQGGKASALTAIGKKLQVFDSNGNAVALVKDSTKPFSLKTRFTIEIGGRKVCEVVKRFSLIGHSYNIEGLPWKLDGDFTGHDYRLTNGDKTVMTINKKVFTRGDSYELDIADPKHELVCLCIVLAVDCSLVIKSRA